jgi:basic membrane lipoprotein Med (substrate-binding protein (PBP1-ABC) superfamily)
MQPRDGIRGLILVILSALVLLLLLASSLTVRAESNIAKPLKIGFLFVGPISDWGWSYAQNEGRLFVDSALRGKVESTSAENVPEGADAERVMEKMIAQGAKLIFATSYAYLEPVLRVAARHPDVKFMQLSRFETRPNLGTYFYLQFQPMYVAGVVAGRMTKTNKIGFVGSHPIPPIVQTINAFALGVQSVNPKARVKVVWTNTWVDPALESEAAKGLFDGGIDVLGFDLSNPVAIVKTAESHRTYVVGCYTDVHQFAPKYWLTGASFNWGPYYTKVAQSVLDNNWKNGLTICGAENGSVKLSSFGPAVPQAVQQEATKVMEKIRSGKFTVFQGPVKDTDGKIRLAARQKPEIKWLATMDFFVPGVEGSLPRK